jgi:hypothetical protein
VQPCGCPHVAAHPRDLGLPARVSSRPTVILGRGPLSTMGTCTGWGHQIIGSSGLHSLQLRRSVRPHPGVTPRLLGEERPRPHGGERRCFSIGSPIVLHERPEYGVHDSIVSASEERVIHELQRPSTYLVMDRIGRRGKPTLVGLSGRGRRTVDRHSAPRAGRSARHLHRWLLACRCSDSTTHTHTLRGQDTTSFAAVRTSDACNISGS